MTIKQVEGIVVNNSGTKKQNVTIRFTSDNLGESLSFEDGEVMILVKYKDVEKIINETRKNII